MQVLAAILQTCSPPPSLSLLIDILILHEQRLKSQRTFKMFQIRKYLRKEHHHKNSFENDYIVVLPRCTENVLKPRYLIRDKQN